MNKLAIWLTISFYGLSALPLAAQNDLQVIGSAYFTTTEVAAGAEVIFLVRFENNGTDTVQNLVIRDTLDPRFDASTLRVIDASHGYQFLRDQGFVRWYFNGIRLPNADPDFSDNSTGYIMYAVSLHDFLNSSQVIHNTVCISFDDETVCTNIATVWVMGSSSAPFIANQRKLSLAPNPNNGTFRFNTSGDTGSWWITDTHGNEIQRAVAAEGENEISMVTTPPGFYLLWLRGQQGLSVELFAVIR